MFDPARLPPKLTAVDDALAATVEEAGLNAAQPREQLLYDGWLLRHCPGKARRARSVNAIAEGRIGLVAKIDRCRSFYDRAGLPCLFRITPFSRPAGLDGALAAEGFTAEEDTRVMARSLQARPGASNHRLREVGVEEFAQRAGELRGSPAGQVAAHASRLASMSPALRSHRLALEQDGRVVAVGQSVRQFELVGLYDIVTAESARNRGLATALTTELLRLAVDDGACVAYLQVAADNIAARSVYHRLGFADRYAYWYRVDPAAPRGSAV